MTPLYLLERSLLLLALAGLCAGQMSIEADTNFTIYTPLNEQSKDPC